MKKFFLICVFVLASASQSFALIAQESTQTTVKLKAIAEYLNSVEMKLNQLQMLAQLPQSIIGEIHGMKSYLTEQFSQVRGVLEAVEGITHMTDDIESAILDRHPEWADGLSIEDLFKRNEKRGKQWKESVEAYLKTLNMTAAEFENDEKTREKLMSILANADGQVRALQALGAITDHANSMLARNEQTLQGFMTNYLEAERDETDRQEDKEKSILEAYGSIQNIERPGVSYSYGFAD